MMVSHVQQVQKEYSRSALEAEEARSPLTRASLEAGVRVLKLATSTARSRDQGCSCSSILSYPC